ncbi:MAG: NAD-dependent epimerase/dehydratase family protein [Chloroflexota bacterium]|nr:NAD-dependent epimerase/dehydratase family protein [Chloroflexota bacterium]
MRFIVTGGSGFVGSHLVDFLSSYEDEVIILDKLTNHSNTDFLLNKENITHYFVDMSRPSVMSKIIKKNDIVIHLAAQSHVDVSFKNPHSTVTNNVLATLNVLEASLKNNASKVMIMSTDEVYGPKEKVIDEKSLDPTNPYSASKAAADMIVNSYIHMHKDLHINILRSNNIAGPRQFIRNIIPRFSCLGVMGKKMILHGDGSSRRRYLWVEDAISAINLIITKGSPGEIYNIGHEQDFTNLEVAEKIGDYLGLTDFIGFEEDRIFNDPIYPCSSIKLKEDLGWSVTKDLDEFLPQTIEWYRENISFYKPFLD